MSVIALDKLADLVEQLVHEWMGEEQIEAANLDNWPLDSRAKPSKAWVSKELFVVPTESVVKLDYFGGLEYVDKEHRRSVGNLTVFSAESSRVREIIEAIYEKYEDDEEELEE